MRWLLFVFLFTAVAACQPAAQQTGLTIDDYVRALRDRQMHDIRVEPNRKQASSLKAVQAADIYIAGQHLLVIQGEPTLDASKYAGLLQGYTAQQWNVLYNRNLAFVAEPETQKSLIEAFQELH